MRCHTRGSLTPAMALCSSTSTRWLPPSFRRCFSLTPLPAPPSTSCSTTSFLPLAISPPVCPSPASPSRPGFPLLLAAWTPATGSLSQSSTKVRQSRGRHQTPTESPGFRCVCGWPRAWGCSRRGPGPESMALSSHSRRPFPSALSGKRPSQGCHTCQAQKED